MLLLIAFCLCYLKELVFINPFANALLWCTLDAFRWSNHLRREMTINRSNNSSFDEPPAPLSWRFEQPVETKSVQPEFHWLWPSCLQLHLLCHSMTAVISLHMWFYILHFKIVWPLVYVLGNSMYQIVETSLPLG